MEQRPRSYETTGNTDALISDDERGYLKFQKNSGYKIKERTLENDVQPLFSEDYKALFTGEEVNTMRDFDTPFKTKGAYSGAEYPDKATKKPNITLLPNLGVGNFVVMGCTMGHEQRTSMLPIQEIYEFRGYGAMLLRGNGKAKLFYAKPGDKVLVPGKSGPAGTENNMTAFNLDQTPLPTLDLSNPDHNLSKKYLQRLIGPPMCVYYDKKDESINFCINPDYLNPGAVATPKDLHIRMPSIKYHLFQGEDNGIGKEIQDRLQDDRHSSDAFERAGIELVAASPRIELYDPELGKFVSDEPIEELAERQYVKDYLLLNSARQNEKKAQRIKNIGVQKLEEIKNIKSCLIACSKDENKQEGLLYLIESADDTTDFVRQIFENRHRWEYFAPEHYATLALDFAYRGKVDEKLAKEILEEKNKVRLRRISTLQ